MLLALIWSLTAYFSPFLISSSPGNLNVSTLYKNPSAVFFAPSLIPPKSEIDFSLSKFSYIPQFTACSFSFGHKGQALGIQYLGTKEINEKLVALGTSKEWEKLNFGFSVNVLEKFYYEFASRNLGASLSISKASENLAYGLFGSFNISTKEKFYGLFLLINSSVGKTYLDFNYFGNTKIFSVCQELNVLPFVDLTFGLCNYPKIFSLGLSVKNYIKPSVNFRYFPDLGFITTWGIEYTL